jgi:hypothetical protein
MKPKDWPEYFEAIEKRPAMYLGRPSLTRLEFEIQGIRVAEDIYNIPEEKKLQGFSFEKFEEWVDEKYNTNHDTVKSFSLAHTITNSKKNTFAKDTEHQLDSDAELAALELWFTWYHQYQDTRIFI